MIFKDNDLKSIIESYAAQKNTLEKTILFQITNENKNEIYSLMDNKFKDLMENISNYYILQ